MAPMEIRVVLDVSPQLAALAERIIAALRGAPAAPVADDIRRGAAPPSAVSRVAPSAPAPDSGQPAPAVVSVAPLARPVPPAPSPPAAEREAAPVPPAAERVRGSGWLTDARKEIIRREWPLGTSSVALRALLERAGGPPVPDGSRVATAAANLGVRRPPAFDGTRTIRAAAPAPPDLAAVEADFGAVRDWAARQGLPFDGDMQPVNHRRGRLGLPPFVLVDHPAYRAA